MIAVPDRYGRPSPRPSPGPSRISILFSMIAWALLGAGIVVAISVGPPWVPLAVLVWATWRITRSV